MLPNNAYYHAFCLIPTLGPKSIRAIAAYCENDVAKAWHAFNQLPDYLFKRVARDQAIMSWRAIQPEKAWDLLNKQNIQCVSLEQVDYPSLLKKIHTPPPLLYYRGRLPSSANPLLTVVGTRRISPYGHMAIERLLKPVVDAGIGIVSGLAFGVDAASHTVAVKGGGYTLAVLGSGVERITPAGNDHIGRGILAAGGCIMSEFAPGQEGYPSNFPRRNRLLAGLSPFTLVIEAAEKSGALITTRCALDENRDVGAVPGPIDAPTSLGCLQLIKDGAFAVTKAEDILQYYGISVETPPKPCQLSAEESQFIQHLGRLPQTLDVLMAKTKLEHTAILAMLTQLEIRGIVRQIPGQGFALIHTL